MKKFLLFIVLSFLISFSAFARSTGCKEGNCENGYGKNGLQLKNKVKESRHGQMDMSTKVNLKIASGVDKVF